MAFTGEVTTTSSRLRPCQACERVRHDTPVAAHVAITPSAGGGWGTWNAALSRHLTSIGDSPTRIVLVTQEPATGRYVQLMIGYGLAVAETSSNELLGNSDRLVASDIEVLSRLGWIAPTPGRDRSHGRSATFTLHPARGAWGPLGDVLTATVVGVLGFREHAPVQLRTLLAAHPCRACSWRSDRYTRPGTADDDATSTST